MTTPRPRTPRDDDPSALPFPPTDGPESPPRRDADLASQVLSTIETMSRRIEDLARELNCLGYFDDDERDGPRAA